jgi:hypothetical protein
MNVLDISGVRIPLPEGWSLPPGGTSYRKNALGVPINEDRRQLAEKALSIYEAKVELSQIQGLNALYCRYQENDCTIVSYSLQLSLSNEVVAVYVFRPGHDVLENEVDLAVRSY